MSSQANGAAWLLGRILCFRKMRERSPQIALAPPLSHPTTPSHPPWVLTTTAPPRTTFKIMELLLDYVAIACPFKKPMQIKISFAMPLFLQPGIPSYDGEGAYAMVKAPESLRRHGHAIGDGS